MSYGAKQHRQPFMTGEPGNAPAWNLNSPSAAVILPSFVTPIFTHIDERRQDAWLGELRRGVDPMQLYISIAGLAYFYLSNKHTLGAIFGQDLMRKEALDQRLSHITGVVTSYVRAA